MENNEFEKVETKKKKNRGIVKSHKKNKLAKIATVLLIASLISIFAGCTSSCNPDKDDPSIDDPGIITPVPDPDDDKDDEEIENPGDEEENPGDEEENPGEDLPPEDIPPEDIPPDDKPPEEENPGDEDIPDSIDKVDEVDEINYFADEFIEKIVENYGDEFVKTLINNGATIDDLQNAEWSITKGSANSISQIEAKLFYTSGSNSIFRVATITFDQEYAIQDILNGNAGSPTVTRTFSASVGTTSKDENLDLGKTVIQTIDADNNLEGDIWCSIGSISFSNGKEYRPITVYQITENGVEEYYMVAEAPSADPASIIANIQEGKYTTTSQSTEYTFAGEKIEQANESSQNLATYNYDFDDIVLC